MSAETLRRAAALMRERAMDASDESGACINWWGVETLTYALDETFSPPNTAADAEHIASWHPAVALAVADWLELVARIADEEERNNWGHGTASTGAFAVARAYLNESA